MFRPMQLPIFISQLTGLEVTLHNQEISEKAEPPARRWELLAFDSVKCSSSHSAGMDQTLGTF